MNNKKTASVIIRSTIFWVIMDILAIIYSIIALLIIFLPKHIRYKVITTWAKIFTLLAKYICGMSYTVFGSQNIINTPVIIASNHQSSWETMALTTVFPIYTTILKRELLFVPFFGWAVATTSPIAINRNNRTKSSQQILKQSVKRIKDKFSILVFPEGTRVASEEVQPFKYGVGRMALALNLPIIPVAHNAGLLMPRKSLCLYPGNISVVIGNPIYPLDNETAEELTQRLEQIVRTMLKPLIDKKIAPTIKENI